MLKVICISFLLFAVGCKENVCGDKVSRVDVNVESDASGFDVVHFDSCGGEIRTMHHQGRKLDTALLIQMMQTVGKDVPIQINVKEAKIDENPNGT